MASSDDDIPGLVQAYKRFLDGLGQEGRQNLVDIARRVEDWPGERFLALHASKWGLGLRPKEYAQLAFDIKNRAGTHVYAYVHPVHRNRGLAFADLGIDGIVQVDTDQNLNFDLIYPPNGAKRWLADKTAIGTYWRLRDTER